MVALFLVVLTITATTIVVFGSQTMSTDTRASAEALKIAQRMLEEGMQKGRNNYDSVDSVSGAEDIYTTRLDVPMAGTAQCSKELVSRVTWQAENGRTLKAELSSNLSNIPLMIALTGDCETDKGPDGWTQPNTLVSRELKKDLSLGDNPTVNSDAGTPATDIDVLESYVYMTANSNKDNFFILDGTNLLTQVIPPIKSSFKLSTNLTGIDVAKIDNKIYAFIGNDSRSGQLQVIEVTNPTSPAWLLSSSSTFPTLTAGLTCPGSNCPGARSIFYYNKKVFLGTQYLSAFSPTQNHEFFIYDVSTPSNPVFLGSYNVNHNINDIVVKGNYAYLATSGNVEELIVLDISNPANINQVGSFDAKNSDGVANDKDGTNLFVMGNKLYLGREAVNKNKPKERDFFIIDITNPLNPEEITSVNLQDLSNVSFQSGTKITGIRVVGKYAFVTMNASGSGFGVLDVSNLPSIGLVSAFNFSNYTTGVDYENGFIFTSNNQNHALRIIRPAQCSDKVDNDGDGKIDILDPQCHTDGNPNNPLSYDPEDDKEAP